MDNLCDRIRRGNFNANVLIEFLEWIQILDEETETRNLNVSIEITRSKEIVFQAKKVSLIKRTSEGLYQNLNIGGSLNPTQIGIFKHLLLHRIATALLNFTEIWKKPVANNVSSPISPIRSKTAMIRDR